VFYVALGYFISYLPCALLTEALSSGIVPGLWRADAMHCVTVDHRATVLALAPEVTDRTHGLAAAASLDDHRQIAALIQQAMQNRLAERFL
jgi:hypothetical protein